MVTAEIFVTASILSIAVFSVNHPLRTSKECATKLCRTFQRSKNYGEDVLRGGLILCEQRVTFQFFSSQVLFTYRMHEFNQSLRYDQRMHTVDIAGSIAYAKALCLAGLLTKDEEGQITNGLKRVEEEWASGSVSANSKLLRW